MKNPNCKAYQESDEMVCPKCGLRWDINDIDPPKCLDNKKVGLNKIKEIKEKFKWTQ